MAQPVTLSVNVDLKLAEVKLRAFEIRAARALNFSVTGRPSFSVPTATTFLPPTVGSASVVKGDSVSQVQFTAPAPIDQTVRALGLLGAADVIDGRRVAGINKQLDIPSGATVYAGEVRKAIARGVNPNAINAMRQRLLGLQAGEAMALSLSGGGIPPNVPAVPVSVPAPLPGPALPPAAAVATGRRRRKGGRSKGFAAISARRGAEALRLGRGLRLTTAAGAVIAAIAVAEGLTDQRSRLLREAAESGDPGSFSYEDAVIAETEDFVSQLRDVGLGAAGLSAKIGLATVEFVANAGLAVLAGVGERTGLEARAVSGEIARASEGAISGLQNVFDNWSGKTAERNKALLDKQDAWDESLGKAIEKSNEETDKNARSLSYQALSLGFMFGTGQEIEQRIAHELRDIKQSADELEFRRGAKPRPTMRDMSGIKD